MQCVRTLIIHVKKNSLKAILGMIGKLNLHWAIEDIMELL